MSTEAIASASFGVALLAVLVPLILTLHGRVVAELGELRRDLHGLAERVARIEGALTGPWRPANGSPAAAPKGRHPGGHRRVTCHFRSQGPCSVEHMNPTHSIAAHVFSQSASRRR